MALAVADTLAQKLDLDVLMASRKSKQRTEFPLYHRTRKWMQANSDSQQMYVRNLLVNDIHYDKHLILRVFAHVLELFKMQVPASTEDELGKVEQFSIYHYDYYR
jgi:hypothetical protein